MANPIASPWRIPPGTAPTQRTTWSGTWDVVVESLFVPADAPRLTYGQAGTTYGEGVAGGAGADTWRPITCDTVNVSLTRGDVDATPTVGVDQADLQLLDPDGGLQPLVPLPIGPTIGSMVRVSVTDGTATYPLFTGRVGELIDTHDTVPRTLELRCYGVVSDLAEAIDTYTATDETAQQRVDSLLQAVGWRWGSIRCQLIRR